MVWLCLSRAVGKTGFQLVMTLLQLFSNFFCTCQLCFRADGFRSYKKKAVTRRPRTGKFHSKIGLSDVFFYVNDVVLLKNGAAVDLLHPSCCKVV